jgi:arsenite-transporting ATPase
MGREPDSKKIFFFGGKGGVGKTTISSSFAMKLSQSGIKTLLISTDPAHNIGDIFQKRIGGSIKKIASNLWGYEIDPETETKKYIDTVKNNLKGLIKPRLVDEVYRQIDLSRVSPGTDEAALFDRIVSVILEEREHFDAIIFDTAPTGHTIRLMSLPELMGVWVEGMLTHREEINENYESLLSDGKPQDDPISSILNKRKERFAQVREILLDTEITSFFYVLTAEKLPIIETKKAIALLHKYKIPVPALIINKILPDEAEDNFLEKRKKQERVYLQEIEKQFHKISLFKIPMLEKDITGKADLEVVSGYLGELTTDYGRPTTA